MGRAAEAKIPPDATVIDTSGRVMMPGMWEMHAHLDLLGHGNYGRWFPWIRENKLEEKVMEISARQFINAGITGPRTRLVDATDNDLRAVVETNLLGALFCAREAVRRMAHRGPGRDSRHFRSADHRLFEMAPQSRADRIRSDRAGDLAVGADGQLERERQPVRRQVRPRRAPLPRARDAVVGRGRLIVCAPRLLPCLGDDPLAAVLLFDVFFTKPYFWVTVHDAQYLVTFAVMLAVGLLASVLTARNRYQAEVARRNERRTELTRMAMMVQGQNTDTITATSRG